MDVSPILAPLNEAQRAAVTAPLGPVLGFQILDSEDQQRLIKKVIRAAELDDTRWVPREVQWFINSNKDEGRRPQHLKEANDPTRSQLIRLYAAYEAACARTGVVDL